MSTFDPDLDTPRARPQLNASGEGLAAYQRLFANPLPTVLGLLGAWLALRSALRTHNLALFLLALFLTGLSPFLIQFHCLDCGRTDFALRSRRHVCVEAIRRWRLGEDPPRLPPRLRTQVKAWTWSLALAVVIYAIFTSD
jgi:hypothetical protein